MYIYIYIYIFHYILLLLPLILALIPILILLLILLLIRRITVLYIVYMCVCAPVLYVILYALYGPRQLDAGCIERLGNKGYVISFRCDHVEVELAEDVTVSLERVDAEIVCTLPNATATALKHQVTRITARC